MHDINRMNRFPKNDSIPALRDQLKKLETDLQTHLKTGRASAITLEAIRGSIARKKVEIDQKIAQEAAAAAHAKRVQAKKDARANEQPGERRRKRLLLTA